MEGRSTPQTDFQIYKYWPVFLK